MYIIYYNMNNSLIKNDLIFNLVLNFMIFYICNLNFMQTIFVEKNIIKGTR